MKIRELDEHCGNCPLVDYCTDPYETPKLCAVEALENVEAAQYIEIANTISIEEIEVKIALYQGNGGELPWSSPWQGAVCDLVTERLSIQNAVEKMFVVSTKHICEATARFLESPEAKDHLIIYPKAKYGWFIRMNLDEPDEMMSEDMPDDLRAIFKIAVREGCWQVCLDRDGYENRELPVYDWKGKKDEQMEIFARLDKTETISEADAKDLVQYAYINTPEEEKKALEERVEKILENLFSGESGYVPGSSLETLAEEIGEKLEYGCDDIDF